MSCVGHNKSDRLLSEQLSTSGFRFTPQRQHVYEVLMEERDHPTAAGLIPDARKNLEEIRKFLIDKKIITVPGGTQAKVVETPSFARATTFAQGR